MHICEKQKWLTDATDKHRKIVFKNLRQSAKSAGKNYISQLIKQNRRSVYICAICEKQKWLTDATDKHRKPPCLSEKPLPERSRRQQERWFPKV